jgi:hypothetical protein
MLPRTLRPRDGQTRYSRRQAIVIAAAAVGAFASSALEATAQLGTGVDLEINRSGSRLSGKGPAEWFTGAVRVDPLFQPRDPPIAVVQKR